MGWTDIRDQFQFSADFIEQHFNASHEKIALDFYNALRFAADKIKKGEPIGFEERDKVAKKFDDIHAAIKSNNQLLKHYNRFMETKANIWRSDELSKLLYTPRPSDVDGSIENLRKTIEIYFEKYKIKYNQFIF